MAAAECLPVIGHNCVTITKESKQLTHLLAFSGKMAYSEPVRIKVRVHNKMYDMTIPKYQFEDVNVRGLGSSVIQALTPEDASSTVLGNYKYPVEIISAEPLGVQNNATNDEVQVQVMETEVCNFTFSLK